MRIDADLVSWTTLLHRAGAAPSNWVPTIPAQTGGPPSWLVELQTTGVEVELGEIARAPNGLFTYRGQQVLIYIKDTQQPQDLLLNEPQRSKRFHFMDCQTIDDMKAKQRYERYVAIARTEGLFPVFTREEDGTALEMDAPLRVCKNCLKGLDYRGYATGLKRNKRMIWEGFSIGVFFEENASAISRMPANGAASVGPNDYTADWPEISKRVRAAHGWVCQACQVKSPEGCKWLQVHHRNGLRADNRESNLVPLCIECHGLQPMHETMFVPEQARRELDTMRRVQGCRSPRRAG